MILGLTACGCHRGNWGVRWPVTPSGVVQCQWCSGLRWLGTGGVRDHVRAWITAERALYADTKYAEDGENRLRLRVAMRDEGLVPTWLDFIGNYLKRAELFGLETPQGRQAFGKTIVTMLDALETAVEVHGQMPEPGYPSGEIVGG